MSLFPLYDFLYEVSVFDSNLYIVHVYSIVASIYIQVQIIISIQLDMTCDMLLSIQTIGDPPILALPPCGSLDLR